MSAKRMVSRKLTRVKAELQALGVKVRFVELSGGRTWSCKYGACTLRGQDFLLVDRKLPESAIYSLLMEELAEKKRPLQDSQTVSNLNLQARTSGTKQAGAN